MRSGRVIATGIIAALSSFAVSQQASQGNAAASQASAPAAALTIYNENFAVARTTIDLDLHAGQNDVSTNQVTTQLEPDSVVLRDVTGKSTFQIAEQDYDAAVVTQDWLLNKYEGKTIDFQVGGGGFVDGHFVTPPVVKGTIVRAPHVQAINQYGGMSQMQPLIEVNGKMQFQLPGTPLFPAATDGLLLKPTLRWQIASDKAQKVKAELAYVTAGMSWQATYNIVTGDAGSSKQAAGQGEEKADVDGWVTITNRTGADFPQARIKLMAGDVAKVQAAQPMMMKAVALDAFNGANAGAGVTQKAFDDFHLYDLNRTVSLIDGETKQVQFIDKPGVTVTRSYLYDGADQNRQPWSNYGMIAQQQNFGLNPSNTRVEITEEIKNSEANHLGVPLPAGRLRLYRRDSDGQMEFVGESTINHTPVEDTIKMVSGNAFDVKGARRQTNFSIDTSRRTLNESFEVKLTNQKDEPVTVTVVEHLYRGENWEIQQNSSNYTKLDSNTISFPVTVASKGDATLNYTVRYTW